jgi:hypothetical protein
LFFSLRSLQTVCAFVIRLGTAGVPTVTDCGVVFKSEVLADMIGGCEYDQIDERILTANCEEFNL